MTLQRRRGKTARFWLAKPTTNFFGDKVQTALDGPYETRVWVIPQRSSRAEVPGQQEINVIRIGVDPAIDATIWARVEIDGQFYDVASPPGRRYGSRHVRHQSIDLRLRTVGGGQVG